MCNHWCVGAKVLSSASAHMLRLMSPPCVCDVIACMHSAFATAQLAVTGSSGRRPHSNRSGPSRKAFWCPLLVHWISLGTFVSAFSAAKTVYATQIASTCALDAVDSSMLAIGQEHELKSASKSRSSAPLCPILLKSHPSLQDTIGTHISRVSC